MSARLIGRTGPTAGQDYLLTGVAIIGAAPDSQIRIVAPGVSRTHARIVVENGQYFIEDAGATNGAAAFATKAAKYGKEKEEIREKAEALEKKRDTARDAATQASQHGGAMGTAVSVFQIAIALGSIAIVTKKRPLWYLALVFAALATVQMIYVRLI